MTTVYRIEHHDTKEGVYRNHGVVIQSTFPDEWNSDDKHPTPLEDSLLNQAAREAGLVISGFWDDRLNYEGERYRFGFSSIAQLRQWFYQDDWINWMIENDFILAICDVPDDQVLIGHTQVMFIRPTNYTIVGLDTTL